MKKISALAFLATLAVTMLLPVARTVNATSANHSILRQGGVPMPPPPPGGGGH
jgi:hypothetical protein